MPCIYVLHFDHPLAHARHYLGCTNHLASRLRRHAQGAGSRLCQVLHEKGLPWHLSGLYRCSIAAMRRLERYLKDNHNGPHYCFECSPDRTNSIDGLTPIDLGLLGFPITSETIAFTLFDTSPPHVDYRLSTPEDADLPSVATSLKALIRPDKDALGFIPVGGDKGLTTLLRAGQIMLASRYGSIIGYTAFNLRRIRDLGVAFTTLQQCCVQDAERLIGIGRTMVELIAELYPSSTMRCNVREDLAANHFWNSIGFARTASFPHPTSRRILNHYERSPR